MKIRMDFVTNSSSSSFVAVLKLKLDNGNTIMASMEDSVGEDGFIYCPKTEYRFRLQEGLSSMRGKYVFDSDSCTKVVSGTLKLMCHTEGEEAYRAEPSYMLSRNLGFQWEELFQKGTQISDDAELIEYLRNQELLQDYTDESLYELVDHIRDSTFGGNDAQITQTLYSDGSLSLSIETGNHLFRTSNHFQHSSSSKKYIQFFTEYGSTKQEAQEKQKARKAAEKARMEEEFAREVDRRMNPTLDAIKDAAKLVNEDTILSLRGMIFAFETDEDNGNYMDTLDLEWPDDSEQDSVIASLLEHRGACLEYPFVNVHDYLVRMNPSAPLKDDSAQGLLGSISFPQLWKAIAETEELTESECKQAVQIIHDKKSQIVRKRDVKEDNEYLHTIQKKLSNERMLASTTVVNGREMTMQEYLDSNTDVQINGHVFCAGFLDDHHFFPYDHYELRNAIHRRGGYVHRKTSSSYLTCSDYMVDETAKLFSSTDERVINIYVLLRSILHTPILSLEDYEASHTKETFEERVEKEKQLRQQQREEATKQRAEERQQEMELRRQRAEERQRIAEETRKRRDEEQRVKEEARRARDEAKQRETAEKQRQLAEKAREKAEKERLVAESKAQKEQARQEAVINAVILYVPGEEPENVRKRLNTLFEKLDGAYPDKKISRLNQDHKKWGETTTELYRLLGYPDSQSFLEAYGYTVEKKAGGRPSSVDPVAIIEELHRRYPNGGAGSMDVLKRDNPDIPWKTLANNSKEYFENTLVKHLRAEGILK